MEGGVKRTMFRSLQKVRKSSGKRPVAEPRRRRVDYIERDVRNMELEGAWTKQASDR